VCECLSSSVAEKTTITNDHIITSSVSSSISSVRIVICKCVNTKFV
jgi:hypothetical protein